MNMPDVSVIIPVFNAAQFVRASVSSVLDHTRASLEVICVDDGSTDSSGQVLGQLAASDSRVSVIRLAFNQGVSSARNAGIEQSTGTYVRFLDADDTLPPGALDLLLAAARSTSADLAIGGVMGLEGPADAPGTMAQGNGGPVVTTNIHESAWLRSVPGHHGGNLYRRQLLQKHQIRFDTDLNLGEDQVFQAMAMVTANKVALIPDDVYLYHRYRDASVTNRSPSLRSLSDDLEWRRRIAKMFFRHGLHEAGLDQHRNWSWSIRQYWLKIPAAFSLEQASAFFSLFRSMSAEFGVVPWNASTPAGHRHLLEMIVSGQDQQAYAFLATDEARLA